MLDTEFWYEETVASRGREKEREMGRNPFCLLALSSFSRFGFSSLFPRSRQRCIKNNSRLLLKSSVRISHASRTVNKQERRPSGLMVIERAGSAPAPAHSEPGEHKSTLLMSVSFHSSFAGEVRLERLRTTESCQTLLRDKERIHSLSDSCANSAWR